MSDSSYIRLPKTFLLCVITMQDMLQGAAGQTYLSYLNDEQEHFDYTPKWPSGQNEILSSVAEEDSGSRAGQVGTGKYLVSGI